MPAMPNSTAAAPDRYVHPIAAYRERHGLSLEALGEMCDPPILKFALSRIETGLRKPTFDQLTALLKACNGEVTADEFIRATPKEVAA